jgi:hypothetical protein
MALSDAALDVAGEAIAAAITHVQFHSADPGASGTANVIAGGRFAIDLNSTDGDLSLGATVAATGLTAGAAVWGWTFWSASAAGVYYGSVQRNSGDTNVNASGQYSITSISIPASAS